MADVFISYARADRRVAEMVDVELKKAGFSTWWDASLVAGDTWSDAIQAELRDAKCVVVIWSESSWRSKWVQAEALAGFGADRLVAARLDNVHLGPPFNVVQTVELQSTNVTPGMDLVVAGVRRKIGSTNSSAQASAPLSDNTTFARNYVWAIGRPGSGKSVTLSHLLRYLMTNSSHTIAFDDAVEVSSDGTVARAHNLVEDWVKKWDRGQFPDRTPMGNPLEISILARKIREKGQPLKLTMIESSGEDYAYFLRASKLLPSLERYIAEPDSRLIFLFCSNEATIASDDLLFSSFLTHVMTIISKTKRKRFDATLLACDPDMCQQRLAFQRQCPYTGEPLDSEGFLEAFLPKTHAILASLFPDCRLRPFSIGTIETSVVDEVRVPRVSQPKFEDAEALYEWINDRLAPSGYMSRLGNMFRSVTGRRQ